MAVYWVSLNRLNGRAAAPTDALPLPGDSPARREATPVGAAPQTAAENGDRKLLLALMYRLGAVEVRLDKLLREEAVRNDTAYALVDLPVDPEKTAILEKVFQHNLALRTAP